MNREADKTKPAQPDPAEQSGSAGRSTEHGTLGKGKDTGQGRYGQTGGAGTAGANAPGSKGYDELENAASTSTRPESNPGSGRAERDESEQRDKKTPEGVPR